MDKDNVYADDDACMSENGVWIYRCCTVLSDNPNRREAGSAWKNQIEEQTLTVLNGDRIDPGGDHTWAYVLIRYAGRWF